MTNQAVVAIIVRLAGIYLGLQYLGSLVLSMGIDEAAPGTPPIGLAIAVSLVWISISTTMIAAPGKIARLVVPTEHREGGATGWSVEEFQSAAFSVVGMLLLASTLTDAWSYFTVF